MRASRTSWTIWSLSSITVGSTMEQRVTLVGSAWRSSKSTIRLQSSSTSIFTSESELSGDCGPPCNFTLATGVKVFALL